MPSDRQISGIDASAQSFKRALAAIKDPKLRDEITASLRSLLLQPIDEIGGKRNFHPLTSKKVPSVLDPSKQVTPYSCHVSASAYKVSFTLEGDVMYLRLVGKHDDIDKHP